VPSQVTVWHAWTFAGSGKATFGFLWRAQRQFVRLAEFKGSNALINLCINVHLSPVIRRSVLRSGERAIDPPSVLLAICSILLFGSTSTSSVAPLWAHPFSLITPPLNQGAATIAIANPLTGDAAAPSPPYHVARPSTTGILLCRHLRPPAAASDRPNPKWSPESKVPMNRSRTPVVSYTYGSFKHDTLNRW
jgi:hypothetical protein